ncbi:M4 family metallopeptidase [Microbacterium marinilacus]|uniref:Neutral metalloproteinase n=1 Tax=Microbacterium marinilacus TaxID=415209 RepID=A0ABP7B6F4_9MICO|nr:M4 family metallopeptidase [Microbacterium marinilacus]MBY0687767.1 M4 family metallopeptidase [Microbacterium marinilacus]
MTPPTSSARHGIVPPFLLSRIARLDEAVLDHAPAAARRTLGIDEPFREQRGDERTLPGLVRSSARTALGSTVRGSAAPGAPDRLIFDARGGEDLPGVEVRAEGEPDTGDVAVSQAYDGLGDTYALFWDAFGRDSIDDEGMRLDATVHFGERYDNAFWDGARMVFGDGDGEIFRGFTGSLSIIGHELAHGVTERTANLVYQGQSGALNEHVSDVFGVLVEQRLLGHTAREATWLVGAGVFTEEVRGEAIRSMRAPGTAYDDPMLGADPQPAHMRDYVETSDDNGGVHINSGIPNRAFVALAETLGGHAGERAGRIWYETLTGGRITATASFAQFAGATLSVARELYGTDAVEAAAVADAWESVGVVPA